MKRSCDERDDDLDPWDDVDREWELRDDEFNSDDDRETDITPEKAGVEVADYLVALFRCNKLSAKAVAELCYYALKAGAVGFASTLAFAPGHQSGAYSRHVLRKLRDPKWDDRYYNLAIPGTDRFDIGRTVEDLPCYPLDEALREEMQTEGDNLSCKLAATWEQLPQSYHNHRVVREAPPGVPVYPISIYVDGVPLTRVDGTVGIMAYNWLMQKRH